MESNQALWEKGDFTQLAAFMRDSGEELVQGLDIVPGMQVLDVGCGDGTTALPAARRGARVLGIDIARNLVAAGNARAQAEGLDDCRFQQGDASRLEAIADHSMDLVLSIFGAMFAPDPLAVAREFVRVVRPGGRIVMGNWIADDPSFISQVLKISARFALPPPEGFISPLAWGAEGNVRARFGAAGVAPGQISCARETYLFRAPIEPAAFIAVLRDYYGPAMSAFEAAQQAGNAETLQRELEALASAHNTSARPDTTTIPATFLKVVVSL